jgi:outer membrane protein OmpA-like peptidoglycan-associated protein
MLREMLAQAARDAAVAARDAAANLDGAAAEVAAAAAKAAAADAAAAQAVAQDPKLRVAEALKRVQDLLKGNAVQFDGAGAKGTQTSALGVPQAWCVASLDDVKKGKNADTLDQLAAILNDYPELSCVLHGSTDADPTKQPDAVLAAHFALNSTQSIQDELAHNRAVACKEGLVARGVPGPQLVVTWKGCGAESKVDFTPMLSVDALAAAELQAPPPPPLPPPLHLSPRASIYSLPPTHHLPLTHPHHQPQPQPQPHSHPNLAHSGPAAGQAGVRRAGRTQGPARRAAGRARDQG